MVSGLCGGRLRLGSSSAVGNDLGDKGLVFRGDFWGGRCLGFGRGFCRLRRCLCGWGSLCVRCGFRRRLCWSGFGRRSFCWSILGRCRLSWSCFCCL
jgi:hypothetical protein